MVKPLPRKWLIHSIEYYPLLGKDEDYDFPIYDDPIIIERVRVDIDESLLIDGNGHSKADSGIVFIDYKNSKPIPTFEEDSKIVFKGKEYRLRKIVECYQVEKDEIHHYELEVV